MATYKKRGFKNKASSNKAEALENKSTTANVFNTLDEGSSRTQQWVEKNQNKILGVVGIVSRGFRRIKCTFGSHVNSSNFLRVKIVFFK